MCFVEVLCSVGLEPRMTVVARARSNLADRQNSIKRCNVSPLVEDEAKLLDTYVSRGE